MFGSRVTVIEGHNKYLTTDQLYDPLRKTFLLDTTARKTELQEISRFSHVTHSVRTHTVVENIQLAEHTFIPEDAKLKPTNHLWKVPKDHQYYIVNAEYRQYNPISQQEMQRILQEQRSRDQIIVYELEGEEDDQQVGEGEVFTKKPFFNPSISQQQSRYIPYPIKSCRHLKQEQEVTQMATVRRQDQIQEVYHSVNVEPKVLKVREQSQQKPEQSNRRDYRKEINKKGSGILLTQPKYNFFSALDEGFNNLLSGKSCTCPSNQIVADQINQISWYGTNIR